jgi:hypothetical protein
VAELGTLKKLTILVEVTLCWVLAILAGVAVAVGYLGHADSPGPHSFNYVLATIAALSACLFYLAAGHLERTSRFSLLHHFAPVAVLLLTFVGCRVAA